MKKIYLFLGSILFSSISFAQITREQANEIIYQYIIDEELRTDFLLLYTTDNLPNAEGISTITNYNNEIFSVEYPCWVYHINEWGDVNTTTMETPQYSSMKARLGDYLTLLGTEICTTPTLNFTYQTVTINRTITSCGNINVQNVKVQNGAKLILDALGEVNIISDFEVQLGSELEIK